MDDTEGAAQVTAGRSRRGKVQHAILTRLGYPRADNLTEEPR